MKLEKVNYKGFIVPVVIGLLFWFCTPLRPAGVSVISWHLLALFVATILGCITKPLPIAGVAIIGLVLTVILGIAPMKLAMTAFGDSAVWMIALAYMLSRGFIKTGLGHRIALQFIKLFGQKTLGLAYSMEAIDLVTAPATPSNTARCGGIVVPIIQSLAKAYGSDPKTGTQRKIGSFLLFAEYHINIVTSGMFMTAYAPNLVAVAIAKQMGINISWFTWFLAAIVPGLILLIIVPFIIYKLYPPEIKETPHARSWAEKELADMGPMKLSEKMMLGVFLTALVLWMLSSFIGLDATWVAFLAVALMLVSGVLSVQDILQETGAWNVILWFSILIFMAGELNTLGFIPWLSKALAGAMNGLAWGWVMAIILVFYVYIHYLFASGTAQATALFGAMLGIAVSAHVPPLLAAMLLCFGNTAMSSTTHYASGPAPVVYGLGYVEQKDWWKNNAIMAPLYLLVFGLIGALWMKVIGIW